MRYFILQIKRIAKLMPFIFIIALILLGSVSVILFNVIDTDDNSGKNIKFKIGLVGEEENKYLGMGIAALQTFDSTRFSIEILQLDENEAKELLADSKISAYAVMPKGFINAALSGEIKTIKYVTGFSSSGINSIMKEEITTVISSMLEESQKGVYGLGDALNDNGYRKISNREMDDLNIKYIDFILERSKLYRTEENGISGGLSFVQYMFSGMTVFFIVMLILPFAHFYIRRDNAFSAILASQRKSTAKQIIAEYAALVCAMTIIVALLGVTVYALLNGKEFFTKAVVNVEITGAAISLISVIMLLSASAFLIFELSSNLIAGITTYFFLSVALCYVSGCLYPIYSLPDILQKFAAFTPTGIARENFSLLMTGETNLFLPLQLFAYVIVFLLISLCIRNYKLTKTGG